MSDVNPKRRLRIQQILVQPVLVWDDGEELAPGPELGRMSIQLSKISHLAETLPAEVAGLQKRCEEAAELSAEE